MVCVALPLHHLFIARRLHFLLCRIRGRDQEERFGFRRETNYRGWVRAFSPLWRRRISFCTLSHRAFPKLFSKIDSMNSRKILMWRVFYGLFVKTEKKKKSRDLFGAFLFQNLLYSIIFYLVVTYILGDRLLGPIVLPNRLTGSAPLNLLTFCTTQRVIFYTTKGNKCGAARWRTGA